MESGKTSFFDITPFKDNVYIVLFRRKRYCILFNSLKKGVHLPGCSTDYDSWPTNIRINNSGSQSSVNRQYETQSICKVNMRERRQYGSELVSIAWFKSSRSYGLVNCVVCRHNLPESITASIYYRGIYARLSICRPTPTELLQTMKLGRFVSERSKEKTIGLRAVFDRFYEFQ